MSTTTKKPPGAPTLTRRISTNPSEPVSASQRRVSGSPSSSNTAASNGLQRTRSSRSPNPNAPLSARAAVKRPGIGSTNLAASSTTSVDTEDEDARAEREEIIDDLKSRLGRAEVASEEAQRHLKAVQGQLDDALEEQVKAEEQAYQYKGRIEALEAQTKELMRREREMEQIYEAERSSMTKEKDGMMTREDELHMIIQRLKDSLAQREPRNLDTEIRTGRSSNNSSPTLDGHFAPPSSIQRSNSTNNSKILLQKDKVIESLRLEVAEAQIKLVESDHLGGGRTQELERLLLEQRVANARLMEDNESFQLLLSEKTLNGDFAKIDIMTGATNGLDEKHDMQSGLGSSLADELESASDGDNEKYRRLETELRSQKDANKALTLYINNIIERLLNHKDFETILDKTPGLMSGPPPAATSTDKELPAPPAAEPNGQSILQRAKSVAIGGGRARPRPQSFMPPPTSTVSTTSNPSTAPSIPLGRSQSVRSGGHRRANSEWTTGSNVVNQMYRGPGPSGHTSPPVGPPPRTSSFFSPPIAQGNPNAAARIPPSAQQMAARRPGSSSNSTASEYSGEISTPSPPHSHHSSISTASTTQAPMPSVGGNKLRPLRLVQENSDSGMTEEEAKRAKRGSWMGWFNRGKEEGGLAIGGVQETINEDARKI